MSFDQNWFNELRLVDRSVVDAARLQLSGATPMPLPRLGELQPLGLVKQTLVKPTSDLVKAIRRLDPNCALPDAFVVHTEGQHIYTRDAGYRERQFNIA